MHILLICSHYYAHFVDLFLRIIGCPETIEQINCSMGIHLKGTIDPPLVGVAVTVLLSNGQAFNVITDKNGIYKAGPMAADVTHTVV